LSQFGIVESSFFIDSDYSQLSFTVDLSLQKKDFTWISGTDTVNIIYAAGSFEFVEHSIFGRKRGVRLAQSSSSTESIDTTVYDDPLIAAHIVLMLVSFMILAPLGTLFPLWNNYPEHAGKMSGKQCCTKWFRLHWMTQTLAMILGYVGILLAYLYVNKKPTLQWRSTHEQIGLAVLILSILQPLFGHFRPGKEPKSEKQSSPRTMFEFLHPLMGYSLVFLAMINCVLGIAELGKEANGGPVLIFGLGSLPSGSGYSGTVGILILTLLVLNTILIVLGLINKHVAVIKFFRSNTSPVRMEDEDQEI
jgi:cytochrome b561